MFLIPSIETAGDTYIFSMPTGLHGIKGFISILPISQQGSIAINIVGHATGFFYSNETIQYNTTKGEKQHYISVYPLNQLDYTSSVTISSTSKFLISFMTPYIVSTDEADGECGFPCYQDYVTFFPSPVFFTECNGVLSPPDQRIITNDFTTRLYVSPPKKSSDCDEIFIMTIYNKEDNVNGDEEIITAIGSSTIDLRDKSEMGSSTSAGQMPIYRLGSARDYFDSLYEYGHFLHLVPSTEEWVTGKSQFYSLAKDCIIEFYTDQAGSDVNSILFDGKVLTKYGYIKDPMNYFKKTYFHFQVAVHGYGLHTLENDGKYVLYVICKHVNSVSDAAGYLTGFNRRKTQN
uniref:IgGFc_binding domain-containing protein n=1 Tax=Rhabditophanes sp. KR3021 TaxID=114890 RepID=A0AC35TQ14_9BILA